MAKGQVIDLRAALAGLTPLAGRAPDTSEAAAKDAFARLASFGEGALFVAAFDGRSPWERHEAGDELVFAVEGQTDLVLFQAGQEVRRQLKAGELIVVPRGTWHRFETDGVRLLTATPLPTDHHSGDRPPAE